MGLNLAGGGGAEAGNDDKMTIYHLPAPAAPAAPFSSKPLGGTLAACLWGVTLLKMVAEKGELRVTASQGGRK